MAHEGQLAEEPLKTYPALGIVGVLLGAMLATFFGRLLSIGLGDIRGALHIDVDSGSWLSTAFNMGQMFIGPFSVYLGGLLGARRVLLACAAIFTVICCVLPFSGSLFSLITLLTLAGLTAGTFYPLTISFVLRNLPPKYLALGIGAYALDIVVTTHIGHAYEGWLMTVLSWKWIFWTVGLLTPLMMAFVYFGIQRQPLPAPAPGQAPPSWRGFFYASAGAALLYGALDQGQRLDWWRSSLFIAMTASGLFLVMVATIRHFLQPNPLINFRFLQRGNTMLLGIVIIFFRFGLLSAVVLVPSFLASAQGYAAEQTGAVLLWIAVPQIVMIWIAVQLLGRIDSRITLAMGFTMMAIACFVDAQLSSAWSGSTFRLTQLVLGAGEAFAFTGMVGTIILEIVNSGSVSNAADVLTFAGFFQTIRLFGGEIGTAFIQYFLQNRERFHSYILGLHVQQGSTETAQRVLPLTASMSAVSGSQDVAAGRALALLDLTIRRQAFTLAIADSFLVLAYAAVACLVVVACMSTLKLQFKQVASSTLPS